MCPSVVTLQWFALAFIAHWIGLIAIAGVYGPQFVTIVNQALTNSNNQQQTGPEGSKEIGDGTDGTQYKSVIAILCVAAIIGTVGASFFLWLMKRAQGRVVKASLALNLLICGVALIICFALGATPIAVIFLIYFVVLCAWSYAVRNRIPFAEAVLTATSHVTTITPILSSGRYQRLQQQR